MQTMIFRIVASETTKDLAKIWQRTRQREAALRRAREWLSLPDLINSALYVQMAPECRDMQLKNVIVLYLIIIYVGFKQGRQKVRYNIFH